MMIEFIYSSYIIKIRECQKIVIVVLVAMKLPKSVLIKNANAACQTIWVHLEKIGN
jgi:hypothetical protein